MVGKISDDGELVLLRDAQPCSVLPGVLVLGELSHVHVIEHSIRHIQDNCGVSVPCEQGHCATFPFFFRATEEPGAASSRCGERRIRIRIIIPAHSASLSTVRQLQLDPSERRVADSRHLSELS